MTRRFEATAATVTEASQSIGLGVAHLVDEGARVVITAQRQELWTRRPPLSAVGQARSQSPGKADDADHQTETELTAARKVVEVNCLAALAWAQQAHGPGCGNTTAPSSKSPAWPWRSRLQVGPYRQCLRLSALRRGRLGDGQLLIVDGGFDADEHVTDSTLVKENS